MMSTRRELTIKRRWLAEHEEANCRGGTEANNCQDVALELLGRNFASGSYSELNTGACFVAVNEVTGRIALYADWC